MGKAKLGELITLWMNDFGAKEGYELSRWEYVKEGQEKYLRVYVDKLENGEYTVMSTDDCEKISRYLSEKLDEEDPIEENYYLEVSSPGMDRILVSDKDFVRFAAQQVEVKLYKPLEGSKTKAFTGELIGKDAEGFISIKDESGAVIKLSSDQIAKINLAVIF